MFENIRIRHFASGQIRISPWRLPGCLCFSQPDFPDQSGFRIRTNSDITVAIARMSVFFTTRFSGPIRISHPDKSGYPGGDCPDFVRISQCHPDFPDKSGFRIRTNLDIIKVFARIFPDFTSEFSGQIRIRIRIFSEIPDVISRISPDFTSGFWTNLDIPEVIFSAMA